MRSPWKTLALLTALTLGLGLAACGDGDVSATTPDAGTAATPGDASPTSGAPGEGGSALLDPTAAGATGADFAKPCDAEACASGTCEGGKCSCSKTAESCCGKDKPAATDGPACLCAKGKAGAPVWCKACDKGYVKGEEVCCQNCVKDALKEQAKDGTQ